CTGLTCLYDVVRQTFACTTARTFTPPPLISPTPTPTHPEVEHTICAGDCNGDGTVTIDELVLGVHIALEGAGSCPLLECNGPDLGVSLNCLVRGVNYALGGCASPPPQTPGACCLGACPGADCSDVTQGQCCSSAQNSDSPVAISWCPPDFFDPI